MKINELLTIPQIAEHWGGTERNLRKTFVNKHVTRVPIIIIGILFTREKVTASEIKEALAYIKFKRDYAKSKRNN